VLGAHPDEVDDDVPRAVLDDGPFRDRQHEVVAVGAVALVTGPGSTVARLAVRVAVVVEQRRRLRVDPEDDGAAAAAVAAVGAAERLELLALDGGDAVAAGSGAEVQHHAVDEGHCHGRSLFQIRWADGIRQDDVRVHRERRKGGPRGPALPEKAQCVIEKITRRPRSPAARC